MNTTLQNQSDEKSALLMNMHRYSMGLGIVKNSQESKTMNSGFGVIKAREICEEIDNPAAL